MSAKSLLVLAAVLCLSCGGEDKGPPTQPTLPTRITLIAPHPILTVGESQQLTIVLTGPDGIGRAPEGPIAWTSSDERVYSVRPTGIAVAVAPGQATITAEAEGRTVQSTLRVDANAAGLRHVQGA